MCRVRENVECRGVTVAWVTDNTNTELMAVKTEEGWREVKVSCAWCDTMLILLITSVGSDSCRRSDDRHLGGGGGGGGQRHGDQSPPQQSRCCGGECHPAAPFPLPSSQLGA